MTENELARAKTNRQMVAEHDHCGGYPIERGRVNERKEKTEFHCQGRLTLEGFRMLLYHNTTLRTLAYDHLIAVENLE